MLSEDARGWDRQPARQSATARGSSVVTPGEAARRGPVGGPGRDREQHDKPPTTTPEDDRHGGPSDRDGGPSHRHEEPARGLRKKTQEEDQRARTLHEDTDNRPRKPDHEDEEGDGAHVPGT
jgi:hypothetical protein